MLSLSHLGYHNCFHRQFDLTSDSATFEIDVHNNTITQILIEKLIKMLNGVLFAYVIWVDYSIPNKLICGMGVWSSKLSLYWLLRAPYLFNGVFAHICLQWTFISTWDMFTRLRSILVPGVASLRKMENFTKNGKKILGAALNYT